MKASSRHLIIACCALTALGASSLLVPGASSRAVARAAFLPTSVDLTWTGLHGLMSAGGRIGHSAGEVSGFDVGEFIVVNDSMVLRATGEVENEPPLGSLDGNVSRLFVEAGRPGLGVGSIADFGNPGSEAISGGGPHGSEVVHFISYGDPMLVNPMMIPPETVTVRLTDFDPSHAKVSLVLYHVNGQRWRVFEPAICEPVLVWVGAGTYDLNFADLPGIGDLDALGSFDVRSGWFISEPAGNGKGSGKGKGKGKGKGIVCHDGNTLRGLTGLEVEAHLLHGDAYGECGHGPEHGHLSGGHFWISSVTFSTVPRVPLPADAWD